MAVAAAALIVLIVGDFGSTFFYHVPQHLWFTLHLRTHHDRKRSFWDQAVPYLIVAALAARISWQGAVLGLALGQFHVWWRHTTEIGWRTPAWLKEVLRTMWVVLPEDHDGHHRNPDIEFGDIFRFYDAPARAVLAKLAPSSRRKRNAALRRSKGVAAQA
jgi:hypothetical protein